MGVYDEKNRGLTMHWQQSERYISNAYEPSRELSPGTPAAGGSSAPTSPRDCTACHKREPPDEPPTPPSGCPGDRCAGCGAPITDRFYLHACERRWHVPCLRCCECKSQLESERSCYARDGNIFCKNDYYRLFGTKRCARCQTAISASEMVMRARDLVFHVHCFSCALCNTPLTKGDTFGIRDAAIYCRLHYDTIPDYAPHMGMPGAPPMCPGGYTPGPPSIGAHYSPYPSPEFTRVDPPDGPKAFFNGSSAPPPRQKGRPRKKKPKDQEIMTANMDLNAEYFEGFRGGGGLGGSSRTKRMRTSFKHHQLRTMKSYFAINHNPDAKDLKQLSQKTGLPKRVLQVWFQNARAKWRRMVTKQDGKMSDKCSPDATMELDSIYHGSMAGSIQSLPPHSPQYGVMGVPASPNSLDCN